MHVNTSSLSLLWGYVARKLALSQAPRQLEIGRKYKKFKIAASWEDDYVVSLALALLALAVFSHLADYRESGRIYL
jgi:hypothetical protein